jgi:uncharacterized protein (DUF433 family)
MTAETRGTLRMVRSPGCIGGSWRLEGTRMSARLLHGLAVAQGMSTQAILDYYPHLTAEQVEYAVAWYGRAYHPTGAGRARRDGEERRPT